MRFHSTTARSATILGAAAYGVGAKTSPDIFPEKAPPIALLGIPFDNVTLNEAARRIEAMIASRQPHHVVTANVDFLVQARNDAELRRILINAHLVLCDGTPLVWASRLLGNPLPERVAGADLVPLLIRHAAKLNYRLFFLGGTSEVNERAVANVRAEHPGAIIAGHYSPPFRQWNEEDEKEIARRIRRAHPDLLFVAFGCPKAEKWIAQHYQDLGVPVTIGVGATIDFLAGDKRRAPRWMQRGGMEWLYRLAQEPQRLFRRYAKDLWHFGGALAEQLWLMRIPLRHQHPQLRHCIVNAEQNWERIQLPNQLDAEVVRRGEWIWRQAGGRHCLLDFSEVRYVDSTGIALLLRLQKKFSGSGKRLRLFAACPTVLHALRRMRLNEFFFTSQRVSVAQRLIERGRNSTQYHHLPVHHEMDRVPERLNLRLIRSRSSWNSARFDP